MKTARRSEYCGAISYCAKLGYICDFVKWVDPDLGVVRDGRPLAHHLLTTITLKISIARWILIKLYTNPL